MTERVETWSWKRRIERIEVRGKLVGNEEKKEKQGRKGGEAKKKWRGKEKITKKVEKEKRQGKRGVNNNRLRRCRTKRESRQVIDKVEVKGKGEKRR